MNRLVEIAVETAAPAGVEHIARALLAIEGVPTALIRVARAARDRGDPGLARELLVEALDAIHEPSSWAENRAFLEAVRTMAETLDVEEAVSAATARTSGNTWLQALLTMARAARDRGEYAHARTLAARVLQDAATAASDWVETPGWRMTPRKALNGAADLLARLGEVERARAAALAIANPRRQTGLLALIVEAALEAGDLAAAEATRDLIVDPSARERLLPSIIRAYLRVGNHASAMTAAQRAPDPDILTTLVTEVVRQSLDEGALDIADALVPEIREHDIQVALRIEVARAAAAFASPEQAQVFLETAEIAVRSTPDPAWRAGALTAAAWALLPGADIGRIGMLTVAAEAAAHRIPDAAPRAAALCNVAAIVAAAGDPVRADRVFEEAAEASSIPCAWAEQLATRALAAADRGHHHTARAQVFAVGSLTQWITEPNNRVRAVQAQVAAAIHIGDLGQAEDAAHAIEHPDQQPLALIDVSRALAAAGQTERAIAVALSIVTEDLWVPKIYATR